MKAKDKTAAKRSSKLRQCYREQGYVPVHVWAHPDYRERIQALAAESRTKTAICKLDGGPCGTGGYCDDCTA